LHPGIYNNTYIFLDRSYTITCSKIVRSEEQEIYISLRDRAFG
jgi:hypothetical protein